MLRSNVVLFLIACKFVPIAASVAGLGMLLMDSKYKGLLQDHQVIRWAEAARQYDPQGYREEFVRLAQQARQF